MMGLIGIVGAVVFFMNSLIAYGPDLVIMFTGGLADDSIII